MIERTQIGRHAIWTEDDGLVCLLQNGVFVEAEATRMAELIAAHAETTVPGEPYFVLADWRAATGVTNEARKVLATGDGRREDMFVAAFGASFAFRVVANLVISAMMLLNRSKVVASFKANEEEARAWLGEKKATYLARKREGATSSR